MELEAAKAIIEELKGRFDNPFSSYDKNQIENLYFAVLGKTFVATSCQQCYHDALVEVIHYLKNNNKMAEKKNFVLRAGVIINCPTFQGGKVFSNDNLTDEVAEKYLKAFPEQAVLFDELPENFTTEVEEEEENKDFTEEEVKDNK